MSTTFDRVSGAWDIKRNKRNTRELQVCCKSLKFLDVPNMSVLQRQQAVAAALLPRVPQTLFAKPWRSYTKPFRKERAEVVAHPGCLDIFLPGPENLEKLLQAEQRLVASFAPSPRTPSAAAESVKCLAEWTINRQ